MASAYDEDDLLPALRVMTRANPVLLGSGRYYVAEALDGTIVGCGGWSHERPGTNEVEAGLAHIRHFGTHPDWTKQGIGRAIYRCCEDAARAAGVCAFECQASLNAEDFYGSLGFERVRYMDIELECGRLLRVMLMRRQL
jgi:N-acetylglutamate synthase-like GNAT family acetyltransferase